MNGTEDSDDSEQSVKPGCLKSTKEHTLVECPAESGVDGRCTGMLFAVFIAVTASMVS